MQTKCLIIDDNLKDLQIIESYILNLSAKSKQAFHVSSFLSSESIDDIGEYDLYILDIDMPNQSGFQLANLIYEEKKDARIIFCSNHDGFVFDSFKLNPFYFVRKSFLKDDLLIAFRKYLQYRDDENNDFLINSHGRIRSIRYEDIVYFEVSHNDLYVHTLEEEYKVRKTSKQLAEEIPDNRFIRIDQNFIINAACITEISDNMIILSNGQKLHIPRRNLQSVRDKYILFLSR